ncbi:uncharacterized protein LOC112501031 [Cynara cardunculus var. scolymus]|uniref:uncharacterized protein LOC112501031 n=1 Tax=Cynara cardunculus var. scolymus TaxID=59895 RepID=UPI000D62A9D7|nr:uncharacterized protein LOC112501031 [Cynara cardunculus var. scolymus]XP_024960436.1 uncharacterized protein LOC112501031 [Cynara cardunculus var. scolymus]
MLPLLLTADARLSTQHHSVCTSSKFPLSGHGVLTKQSGKRKQNVLDAPESVITSCNNPVFPKLTISPLRRFQLIDSDSDTDDPFISECAKNRTCTGSESSLNRRQPYLVQRVGLSEQGKLNEPISTFTRKDLWEDFQPEKSFHIPTPALDEVCEEYFRSMKDKSKSHGATGKSDRKSRVTNSIIDLGDPIPPAHRYFFHGDPRVQELVRTRLPNFFPLNAANRDSEQPSTSNIDYMGQFSHGENSKQAARTNKAETSSRKNSRKSNTREMPKGPVNSKSDTDKGIPKVAGKRRVQADGQPSGHWFMGPDRRRVYVSKTGQELTGRAAYTLYKKESGTGFKKREAKKKASTKKK